MQIIKKTIYRTAMACLGAVALASCTDGNDWGVDSAFSRLFGPNEDNIAVKAEATTAEVTFAGIKGAEYYIIEVSNDSLFGTDVKSFGQTDRITTSPVVIKGLVSDTTYFLRMKALSGTTSESTWARLDGSFKTKSEQIFLPMNEATDLTATSIKLRWEPGTEVTAIKCNGQTYELSAADVAAGQFTITGLTPETEYTANIYNGTKRRGSATFTTAIDLNGATLVNAGDNLATVIANAEAGATLALMPGTYEVLSDAGSITTLTLTKDIAIKSLRATDRAVIKGGFTPEGGTLSLKQVVLDGAGTVGYAVDFKGAAEYGNFEIDDCELRNFTKGLLYNNTTDAKVASFTINNCLIHDNASGADFLDIRNGYIAKLTLTNSTVWESCASRDFVRYDDKSSSYPGVATPVITVDHNTLMGVANNASRRLLYVRYAGNSCVWTNNIVTGSEAVVTNQSSTNVADITGNNNFKCPNLASATATVTNAKAYDDNATTLDPEFVDAKSNDYTVGSAVLLKSKVGDPRWIK